MLPRSLIQSIRGCLTTFYLLLVLITIPISFQVGGLYCGLSFTVTLFNLYFLTTTLKIVSKKYNRLYYSITSFVYYLQHFIIPSLLFLFLSGFNNDELKRQIDGDVNLPRESLVNFLRNKSGKHSWIFYYYYYKFTVKPWQFVLLHSTPYFTLLEGFFTVLGIQAIGETNKWLRYHKNSNTWIIVSLLISGGVITTSLYYLYRIYVTPVWELSIQTASLLGFTLSIVCGLGLYGIVSGKGSVIESSLFFAYIVRCIYEISPQLATSAMDEIFKIVKDTWQKHQGNLPTDNLLSYYRNVVLKNGEMIWDAIVQKTGTTSPSTTQMVWLRLQPLWKFAKNFTISVPSSIREIFRVTLKMATESVTPTVVINLVFRILVFYSATRIIPALQKDDSNGRKSSRRLMRLIYWYSPCIVIAMYTHLILQYSGELNNDLCLWGCFPWSHTNDPSSEVIVDAWGFWNWCNVFCTLAIYGLELIGGKSS